MYGAIPVGLCAVVPCGSAIAFVVCDKSNADFGDDVLIPIVDDTVDPPTFIDVAVIIPEILIFEDVIVTPVPILKLLEPERLRFWLLVSSYSAPVILVNGISVNF